MQNRFLVLVALAIIIGVAPGCLSPATPESSSGTAVSPAPSMAGPLTIAINATPSRYSPVMSSTIGIRLTPVNTSGIIPSDAWFTWQTDFGSFYHWGPPDFRVIELAPTYTGTAEPVYWSYFAEPIEERSQPVNITLTVREPADEEILARASVRIGWEKPSGLTAIVED